jgi:hypothetical protein
MSKDFTKYVVQYESHIGRSWFDAFDGVHSDLESAKKDIVLRKKCHGGDIYRIVQRNYTIEDKVLDVCDIDRDISEAINEDFNPEMGKIPFDSHGMCFGTFHLILAWTPEE